MPEYNNIQTSQKIENESISIIIEKYIFFLQTIGVNSDKIFQDLRNFKLEFEDHFPYIYITTEKQITTYSEIPVIPHLTFFRNENEYFAVYELLIETENIYDYSKFKYKSTILNFIENLCVDMSKSFKNSSIFFTDEMQDSIEIENEWNGNNINWEFDLAIIPVQNMNNNKIINLDFRQIKNTSYNEFYNSKKFEKKQIR